MKQCSQVGGRQMPLGEEGCTAFKGSFFLDPDLLAAVLKGSFCYIVLFVNL